jgi:hypothetical protein
VRPLRILVCRDLKSERNRPRPGVQFAVGRLSERNAVFDEYEVERDALRHGLGKLTYTDVKTQVKERRNEAELLPVHHYRRYAPGERFTTPEAIAMERAILETERDGRGKLSPIAITLTPEDVRKESQLNDPQKWLVWNISQSKNRIVGVQGGAGTGKTFGLDVIRKIIEDHGYGTRGLAPTSSAAKELQKSGMGETMTIQKFLHRGQSPDRRCVYFVDESSLASTVQMDGLLRRMRPEDRLVIVGDIRQHQSVEAGRVFEEMIMAGMETFQLERIVRQADPQLKAIVERFATHDPAGAVQLLLAGNCIHELTHEQERYATIAQRFLVDPSHSLIVSPDNESRQMLNIAVRDSLRQAGLLGPDLYSMEILTPRQNLTSEDLRHAFVYQIGDTIRFSRSVPTLGVHARDYGEVILVNHDANLVHFRHQGDIITFNPQSLSGVTVYETKRREFAVGDRIQFTAPLAERRIANRDIGTIEKLDAAGNARIRLQDGPAFAINLKNCPHIDHGYAMTTYCAQGKTCDHLLMHAPVKDSRYRHMVDEAFGYVGISRPKFSVHVYTDSTEDLGEAFLHRNLKPKALSRELIKEYQAEKAS